MADPVHRAVHTLLSCTAPASAIHCTLLAANTLQQMQAENGTTEAQLLEQGAERLCGFVIARTTQHTQGDGSAASAASAAEDDAAAAATSAASLSAAEQSSLRLEVEMAWQLVCGSAEEEQPQDPAVRTFITALIAMMHPMFRCMHSIVLEHLAHAQTQTQGQAPEQKQGRAQMVQQMILQLFDEFLAAHTPWIEAEQQQQPQQQSQQQHDTSSSILPLPLLRALAPSCVLAAVSRTLSLQGPEAALRVQPLFERRVLPLLRGTALATASAVVPSRFTEETDAASGGVFTSLPALLQKEILPFFLVRSSNPAIAASADSNLRAFYSMLQSLSVQGTVLWACSGCLTPVLLGVMVDHFDAFCAALCCSEEEAEGFFNSLLLLAQTGLASRETLLVKQSLALLLARARTLYGEEDRALRLREQQQLQQQQAKIRAPKNRALTTPSSSSLNSADSSSLLLPRRTCFPDYTLRLWVVYDNLWALLTGAYELHLIKGGGFLEQIGLLLKAHGEFYKHGLQRSEPQSNDSSSSSGGGGRFTPDIFLELLLRAALQHQNPYVRKFVFYSLFASATFRDTVRFSVEFLFGAAAGPVDAAAGETAPPSVMGLLSNPALQPLLPSRGSLLRFWSSQFALLPATVTAEGDVRSQWIQRFLRALVNQSAASASGSAQANLAMHLTFLATLQPQSRGAGFSRKIVAEDDEACVGLIAPTMLMESILTLARSSVSYSGGSTSAGVAGAAQHGRAITVSPMSARVREALARVFVRYTSFDFEEAIAAAASSSSSFATPPALSPPLQTLRNLSVILTQISPPSMRLRSHAFSQTLSRRLTALQSNEATLSGIILWAVQRGLGSGGMGSAEDQESMTASQLLALLSLLPASHPTLEMVSRSIWSGLLDLFAAASLLHTQVHASSRMLFGLEALLGLCGSVELDREQAGAALKAGSFRGVIGALSGVQPQAPTSAAASAPALLDQMLRGFLSSASCETLCAFLRSQLLVSLYDLPPSNGDGVGSEGRAVCFALVSRCIGLYSDLTAVQTLAQALVQGAVERLLLPSASSAPSTAASRPLDQCTAMQVLLTVISSCAAVHPSSPLASLSSLLSGAQVLALVSFLSTGGSGLVTALSGHKTVFGSVAAFRVASSDQHDAFGQAGSAGSTMMVASEQELKALYFRRSQAARWGLLHALLAWSLRELESLAIHSPELLLSASSSSTAASLLFASGPGFLSELVVSSVLDSFDGSLAEFWGPMVQVLSVCVSSTKISAAAASAVLTRVDPASLSPEAQSLLVSWVGWNDAARIGAMLSTVFDQSWRSFQDVSSKKGGGSGGGAFASSASSTSALDTQDWIGWSWRPSGGRAVDGATSGSSEPDVPRIYSSLVGLFLHPLLFSEAAAAPGSSAAPPSQALVKSYLLQLLVLAQKKGMRSLLYALSLALVEAVSAHPAIGVHYLPELAMLLTLDNKLETRSGSAATTSGGRQEQEEERVVPMEHLIRVMLLSLMEHLVNRGNAASAAAASPSSIAADGAYTFCAQSLHYFVSLNFLHAEFGMDRCGGENPLDELERAVDELADQEEGASSSSAADAGEGEGARKSKSSQQPVTDSRVHVAISAVWHALCILSRLRVRDEHAQLDAGGARSLKQRRTAMHAAAASSPASTSSAKPLKKPSKASSSAAASTADCSMPTVTLIDSCYPLLDFVQNSTFILFISPALTSRIRHLLEIFLLNLFVANLPRPGASAAGEDGGARRIECSLLPYLERTVFRQNIVASFLVLAGFLCSYLVGEQFRRDQARLHSASAVVDDGAAGSSFHPLIHSLLHRIHIWSSSPLGQVRTLAQYFFYNLFLEVFHRQLFEPHSTGRSILPKGTVIRRGLTAQAGMDQSQEQAAAASITLLTDPLPLNSVDASTRAGLSLQLFFPVWLFLHRSAEVGTVRARQDEYFREWAPLTRSTVKGMIEYAREYDAPSAAAKEHARVSRGLGGKDAESLADEGTEEDDESIEAVAGIAVPEELSSLSSASSLDSFGTHLSSRDLLLHVRRITSEHLQSLSRFHREQSYFECNDRNPQSFAEMNASIHAPTQSIDGHDSAPSLEVASSSTVAVTPALNFQQKIAPLKSQYIEDAQADVPNAADASSSSAAGPAAPGSAVLPPSSHLVVMASLVSNPLNLGGLCRTAEIMSATLVIPSLSLMDNEAFTGVSSTAHKWARIEVVPRDNEAIVAYLRGMKQKGYELVGLEQTVHSSPLQHARFSPRVVLVLGDEKRGIPAAILNVLTACVEIPQFGLIRSLNVHVSAGMIVWEWIKQALEAGDNEQRAEAAASNGRSTDLHRLR